MTKHLYPLIVALTLTTASQAHAGDWALPTESPQVGGITSFASRSDGTLFACKVNGNNPTATWTATSHGKPGLGAIGQVSASYHSTNTDLYVFTRTVSGNLYLRYAPSVFNNSNPSWSWHNLGKPAATQINSDPASISFNGFEYAFVVGADQHLHSVKGSPWVWSDHGTPAAGVGLVGRPTTILWADSLYVFIVGTNGQLYLRTWNGIAWSWVTAGAPSAAVQVTGSAAAIKRDNTIEVFVGGTDNHVYVREWTGAMWQWLDQGLAANGIGAPDAAYFTNQGGTTNIYAFALRYTNAQPGIPKLIESHGDGTGAWQLLSHGSPPQTLLFRQPAIAAAFSGFIETWPTWRINVLVAATGNRVYRRILAPNSNGLWQWTWPTAYCQM